MKTSESRRCFRQLTVEPSYLLVGYAIGLSEAPFHDLLLRSICWETPGIPYHWCGALPDHRTAEDEVLPKAATLLMASKLIEAIIPAVVSSLAGAWSDRAGSRKPLVIISLTGYVLKYALLAVFMSIPTLPVEYFLISSLPLAFSGGWTTFAGAVISVIGDETGEDRSQRTFRLGLLPAFYFMGYLPGSLLSSIALNTLGNTGVFLISSAVCFFALLIALCTVSETSAMSTDDEGKHETGLVNDVLQTLLKKRSNGQKIFLILSIFSNGSSTMVTNGESNLYYMHGRKEFGWEIIDFTLYRSVTNGLQMMGAIFAVSILSHKMKIADAPLAIVSYLGSCVGSIIMAFASTTWMMYCGSAMSLLQGAASPVMRSIMSKSVHHNELGRVFTLSTSFEALVPVAAQPLYTYLFRKTLISFPGAFFMLSSAMFFIALIFSCIIHGTQKWHSRSERKSVLPREDSTSKLPDESIQF